MSTRDRAKRGTETSSFGAGRRESHDASGFYARFTPPILDDDEELGPRPEPGQLGPHRRRLEVAALAGGQVGGAGGDFTSLLRWQGV